jgi:hypothetical protein
VIESRHLRIEELYESGSTHRIDLIENLELDLILDRGQRNHPTVRDHVPNSLDDAGIVIVSLGVDDNDQDVINYASRVSRVGPEELLGRAIDRSWRRARRWSGFGPRGEGPRRTVKLEPGWTPGAVEGVWFGATALAAGPKCGAAASERTPQGAVVSCASSRPGGLHSRGLPRQPGG